MSTPPKLSAYRLTCSCNRPTGPLQGPALAMVQSLVEKAALVQAINEAWIMIAVLTLGAFALRAFRQDAAASDIESASNRGFAPILLRGEL